MQIASTILLPGLFLTYNSYKQRKVVYASESSSERQYSRFSSSSPSSYSSSSSNSSGSSSSSTSYSSSERSSSRYSASSSSSGASSSYSSSSPTPPSSSSSSERTYSKFSTSSSDNSSQSQSSSSNNKSSQSSEKTQSRFSSSSSPKSNITPPQSQGVRQNETQPPLSEGNKTSPKNYSSNTYFSYRLSPSTSYSYESKTSYSSPNAQQQFAQNISSHNTNYNNSTQAQHINEVKSVPNNESNQYEGLKELALIAVLGVSSFYLASYMKNAVQLVDMSNIKGLAKQLLFGQGKLQSILTNKILPVDLKSPNIANGQLVYGTGNIKIDLLNNKLLHDPMYGISAKSQNILALQRLVHVYKEDKNQSKWIRSHELRKLYPYLYHPCMQEVWFTPSQIKLEQFNLLPNLSLHLADPNKNQDIKLDNQLIDDHYQSLMDKLQNIQYKPIEFGEGQNYIYVNQQSLDSSFNDEKKYQNHAYTFAIQHKRQIVIEKDFIYIVRDMNNFQEGDLRISFQEIKPFLQASVIAEKQGDNLGQKALEYVSDNNLTPELNIGGKFTQVSVKNIGISQGGIETKDSLLQKLIKKLQENDDNIKVVNQNIKDDVHKNHQKILATIIFIVYVLLVDKFDLDGITWGLGLTGVHLSSTLFYKMGVIGPMTLAGLIASAYVISKIKKINKENENTIDKDNNVNNDSLDALNAQRQIEKLNEEAKIFQNEELSKDEKSFLKMIEKQSKE